MYLFKVEIDKKKEKMHTREMSCLERRLKGWLSTVFATLMSNSTDAESGEVIFAVLIRTLTKSKQLTPKWIDKRLAV